jgi:hypothetical protein
MVSANSANCVVSTRAGGALSLSPPGTTRSWRWFDNGGIDPSIPPGRASAGEDRFEAQTDLDQADASPCGRPGCLFMASANSATKVGAFPSAGGEMCGRYVQPGAIRQCDREPGGMQGKGGNAIDAPHGEELMPGTVVASMPHELAARWRMSGAIGKLIRGHLCS